MSEISKKIFLKTFYYQDSIYGDVCTMKFYEWVWCEAGCEWMTSCCCITMETLKLIKIPQAHHFLPCQPAPHLASSNAQLTLNLESLYVYTVKAGWVLNLIIMSEDATSFTSTLITAHLNSSPRSQEEIFSLLSSFGSKHPQTFYSRSL